MAFETELRQAAELAKAGDTAQARAILSNILAQDADNVYALRGMASTSDNPPEAESYLRRILQINPDDQWAQKQMAQYGGTQAMPAAVAEPAPAQRSGCRSVLGVLLIGAGLALVACLLLVFLSSSGVVNAFPQARYLLAFSRYVADTTTGMKGVVDAGMRLQDDNSLVDDPGWRAELQAAMDTVQAAYGEFESVTPPPGQEELHATVLDAGKDCNDAMSHIANGFDNRIPAEVEAGGELIDSCIAKIEDLQESLRPGG